MSNTAFQDKLIPALQEYGSHIALEYGKTKITYRELEKRSAGIARWLRAEGIGKERFVGIYMEDKAAFISALIGILRAGCAFVPLDTTLTAKRLEQMLQKVKPSAVLVDNSSKGTVPGTFRLLEVNRDVYDQVHFPEQVKDIEYLPEDRIYIYFTSGSTGIPKAIVGKNKSLLHFIEWEIETFGVNRGFRVSQLINTGFDAFLRDLFVPLCAGGTLCIPSDPQILLDSQQLIQWIDETRVNLLHCVPSLFRLFNTKTLEPGHFEALKYILLSGEHILPQELKNWYRVFGSRIQLVNLYGPTETTMTKTVYFIQPPDVERERMPVGKPIRGARIIILDKHLNLCSNENFGEIYIRTPYRTHGYYQDPELNRQRFIINPFTHDPNDLFYKTGDLGRVLADGNLDLLGRIDRQVKIRGVRVELEEIEGKLTAHEKVKRAVVLDKKDSAGEVSLRAYMVMFPPHCLDAAELREHLADELPPAAIPNYFVQLEQIPLTPNGKVDRRSLMAAEIQAGGNITTPRDEIEKKLIDIWAEVLKIDKGVIGIDSGFFELGGHSLRVTLVAAKIHESLDVKVPLREMFKNPTVRRLAEYIKKTSRDAYQVFEPAERREFYPLSSAQERLYILQQMDKQGIGFNITEITELEEGFDDRARIEETFRQLIRRHESLRTSFITIGNQVVQRVHDDVPFEIEQVPLRRGESFSVEAISRDFVRPHDLSRAPLLRVGIVKAAGGKDILMADMHHIISDGVSHYLLVRDFMAFYQGEVLQELPIQYKDYALWEHKPGQQEALRKQEIYWLEQFREPVLPLQLPLDYPRPAIQSFAGAKVRVEVDTALTLALKEMAAVHYTSLYMLLLAVYNILLAKLTHTEDIVVATIVSGRNHVDLVQVIGPFVNLLAMRNHPAGEKTFEAFLKEVRENTITAFENRDYPFELLVEKVGGPRDVSRHPLMDAGFTMQNMDVFTPGTGLTHEEIQQLRARTLKFEKKVSKKDINLEAYEVSDHLHLVLEYCTRLFKPATIQRFGRYFKTIAAAVTKNPGQKIADIQVISEEEKIKIDTGIRDSRENIQIEFDF